MRRLFIISLLLVLPFFTSAAQEPGKTLASTLEVYVFPTQGQASAEQVGNFKKAFSVCLEAKEYMVKS